MNHPSNKLTVNEAAPGSFVWTLFQSDDSGAPQKVLKSGEDSADISIAQALARVRRDSRAVASTAAAEPVVEEVPASTSVPAAVEERPAPSC